MRKDYIMAKNINVHTPTFKLKVVVESIVKGNVSQVTRQYSINPNQLSNWRTLFNRNGHIIFEQGNTDMEANFKKKIAELESLVAEKRKEIKPGKNHSSS